MTDIAFLFPGQGSQYVGMGKGLVERYPSARRVFEEAAQGEVVTAANFNSPDQVVIAGHTKAVERAAAIAKAAGAKRAVMLAVSAPFHCSLMLPAQARLQEHLDAATFKDLATPLVNN